MIVDGFQCIEYLNFADLPFPCTQPSPCSQRHQNSLQLILGLRWSWSRSSWSRWRARVLARLRPFIDLQDPSTYDIFFKSLDWVHSFMHLLLLWGSGFWVVLVTKCFWKARNLPATTQAQSLHSLTHFILQAFPLRACQAHISLPAPFLQHDSVSPTHRSGSRRAVCPFILLKSSHCWSCFFRLWQI